MLFIIRNIKDVRMLKRRFGLKQTNKKFDAGKFCGVLKVDEDALTIQHKLRLEWS